MSDKLSGYDTSTTARSSRGSSSSSTDSLASWSSREARDREGEVRPAGLVGEVRPAGLGVNSNGEEGRRIAPLGEILIFSLDTRASLIGICHHCDFQSKGEELGAFRLWS